MGGERGAVDLRGAGGGGTATAAPPPRSSSVHDLWALTGPGRGWLGSGGGVGWYESWALTGLDMTTEVMPRAGAVTSMTVPGRAVDDGMIWGVGIPELPAFGPPPSPGLSSGSRQAGQPLSLVAVGVLDNICTGDSVVEIGNRPLPPLAPIPHSPQTQNGMLRVNIGFVIRGLMNINEHAICIFICCIHI